MTTTRDIIDAVREIGHYGPAPFTVHYKHTVPLDEEAIDTQLRKPVLVCSVQVTP